VVAHKYPCIADTVNGAAEPDNDGRGLDANSLVPFSVASYLAQFDGIAGDQRGQAVLGAADGTTPVGRDTTLPDVTFAVAATGVVPRMLQAGDLHAIYTCDPNYVGTGPGWYLKALLPAAGSAVRTAWESQVGITDADVQAGKYPCIADTVNGTP